MSTAAESDLSDEQSVAVAAMIREELARRRISRKLLADQAKISISTLEKALSGRRPFTLATTIRLEEALGVTLRARHADLQRPIKINSGLAPAELGFYARPAVSWLEGAYLTVRPSFSDPTAIYAYRTEIAWDEGASGLVFRESERVDAAFTQHGTVSVPHQSGHVYLVTNSQGQYRLIIVSRPTISGEMFGILTTLQVGKGSQLLPVAAPIAFLPLTRPTPVQFGRATAVDACYRQYQSLLGRITQETFARFLGGEMPPHGAA